MERAEALIGLQQADLAELRARKRLEELPERRRILETRKKIAEVRQLRERAEEFLRQLEHEAARIDDETAGVDQKLDVEQAKVMSGEITNPKELQNLTREMDALRRRKDKLENESLGVMEKTERATGQLAKVDEALTALSERESELSEQYRRKGGELQTEIGALQARREGLLSELDEETRVAYEEAKASKGGIGLGVLCGDTCTACRVQLPAKSAQALRAAGDVGRCPNCRRLLIVRPPEEEGS